MSASVWNPGSGTPLVKGDFTIPEEAFVATAGQTVFTLTTFRYVIGTGSLKVFVNGVKQFLGKDFEEVSPTQFRLLSALAAGEDVFVEGVVGTTGATAAEVWAEAAAVSAAHAAESETAATESESSAIASKNAAAISEENALAYLSAYRATSYGALASDPATDPLGNPCTAGDEYFNTTSNLLKRFNGATWQVPDINTTNLAAPSGSALVGFALGGTVEGALKGLMCSSITALRALPKTGNPNAFVTGYYAQGDGGGGSYYYDSSDTTSADNGGTIIVASDGGRWKLPPMTVIAFAQFGAKGDAITDDTESMQKAVTACPAGRWLDGQGLTYKVTGQITANVTTFKLRNANFVTSSTYESQGHFTITSMVTVLEDISFDGGRGTYKAGSETWAAFSTFHGYTSIRPSLESLFYVTKYDASAEIHVKNVNFKNVFASACLQVATYGTVFISDCSYKNIANQTYSISHSHDDGVTQAGRTVVNNVYAENVGILPDAYLVDGVDHVFADAYAPQASFNFLVSHGDYSLNNATILNYGSCAVVGDRNKCFNASNISILNDDVRCFSNNPSGAFWIEKSKYSEVSNLTVDIQARDPRDYALSSSSIQIYLEDEMCANFNNISIIGNTASAKIDRGVRASTLNNATININNFKLNGLYVNYAADFAIFDSIAGSTIRLSNGTVNTGSGIRAVKPGTLTIDKVRALGDITVADIATSSTCDNVFVTNSSFVNFTNNTTISKFLGISGCDFSGTINRGVVAGDDVGSEVGTWTPSIKGSAGSLGAYSALIATGSWTKSAGVVHFQGRILLSNKGTWTGIAQVHGLPFPSKCGYSPCIVVCDFITFDSGMTQIMGIVSNVNSFVTLTQVGSGVTGVDLQMPGIANNTGLLISGSYKV